MNWNRLRREALAKARTDSAQPRRDSRWGGAAERVLDVWRRTQALSWFEKAIIAAAGTLVLIATPVAVIALTGNGDSQQSQLIAPAPTATAARELSPTPTAASVVVEPTAIPATVTATPTHAESEPSPASPPLPNRRDCNEIRGTAYLSSAEREWFLANCQEPALVEGPPTAVATSTPSQPGEPPPPPPPTPTPSSTLSSGEVIFLAAGWMADQAPLGYTVSAGSCSASRTAGLQWVVTCQAVLEGCQGGACQITLTACLIEDPLTIWSC